jgi:hypothetical protein
MCYSATCKCKTGNLSDVNSYRAIYIWTAISKVLEHVMSQCETSVHETGASQFGFTAGHLTGFYKYVLKPTAYY